MPTIQAIVSTETREKLRARGGVSEAAREALERYFYLLERSRPAGFSDDELGLITDSCNGVVHEPHAIESLWMGVEDSINLDGLADKWNTDGPGLVAKLKTLSAIESAALIDAVERFWRAVSTGMQVDPRAILS